MSDGWVRASEVLSQEEWEQLDELPPSRMRDIRRHVNGERRERQGRESRSGKRLRKAERIVRKQAAGTFPAPGREQLSTWPGMLEATLDYLEVARARKRDGQSWRDHVETQGEALTRAHELVRTLVSLCPTTEELLEARGIQIHGEAIE